MEGPPIVWADPNFVLHGHVLNWLWFVSMLLMTAATAVTGATVHRDRTLSVAGFISNYYVQFGVFALACILNIIYSLHMRRKYLRAADSIDSWDSAELSGGDLEFQGLGAGAGGMVKTGGKGMGSMPVSTTLLHADRRPPVPSGGGAVTGASDRHRHPATSHDTTQLMKGMLPSS
ncbi:MAG: hypothetical protein WDW38_004042 [Sanguina aurantia]